jgi:GxxExxY protein
LQDEARGSESGWIGWEGSTGVILFVLSYPTSKDLTRHPQQIHPNPVNPGRPWCYQSSFELEGPHMSSLKHADITEKIIGCAMKVHSTLGCGFQEVIYQRCLVIELRAIGMEFLREFEMPILYKGSEVGKRRVDFLVEGSISVEVKALTELEDVHLAQAINYLEAYNLEVGLLLNFGGRRLEFKRLFNKRAVV